VEHKLDNRHNLNTKNKKRNIQICNKNVTQITFKKIESKILGLGFNYGQINKTIHTGLKH
jgi:hypothetical protein